MIKLENNSKVLFFITASFPFGSSETFIESEINYLSDSFDKIIIICHNVDSNAQRKINDNIKVIRRPYYLSRFGKILSISGIFKKHFWKEVKIVKKTYKKRLSIGVLKTMLISLYNAERLKNQYGKIISKYCNSNYQNYCYSYWCNDSALSLSLLNKKGRIINTFCRIHGWDVYFEASKYNYLPFRQFIAANCDMVFAVSESGRAYAIDKWGAKPDQIQISRLGIANNYKIDLKKNEKPIHLVSCSNIISIKRVHLIAESLKLMNNIKFKWTHFGDGDESNVLKSLIKTLPKSIDVILKGRVSNNEIYSSYHLESPNLFINVSSSEGVPVSIMEAMSFGIPVIATNVGGTSEIVTNENGQLLNSTPSLEEICNAIKNFHNLTPEQVNLKKQAAFETWSNNYNATKNYTQFVEEILSL